MTVMAQAPPPPGSSYTDVAFDLYYEQFVTALLKGDQASCKLTVDRWLELDPMPLRLYEQLFQRALYEVGSRWEQGRISVASEHLATFLTESMMAYVYPRLLGQGSGQGLALVACAEAEAHQVGAKMVSDLLELKGWRCCFLGALASMSSLELALVEQRYNLVALSAALTPHLNQMLRTARTIRELFPSLPILVGGQAFRQADLTEFHAIPHLTCLDSLSALDRWLDAR